MRQRIAGIAGCVLTLGLAVAPAFSSQLAKWNEELPDGSVAAYLGVISPHSTVNLAPQGQGRISPGDIGYLVDLQYLNRVWPTVSLGGEFGWAETGDSRTTVPGGLQLSSRFHSFFFMGDVKFAPKVSGSVSPYVIGAAGIAHTVLQISVPDVLNANKNFSVPSNGADAFASWIRAGADFRLNDNSAFGVEGGWFHVEKRRYQEPMFVNPNVDAAFESLTVVGTFRYFF